MEKTEVKRAYELANLEVSDQDLEVITDKFNQVLDFIDEIFEVDTEGVEATEMLENHRAVLRKDDVKPSLTRDQALENAKDKEYGFFRLDWSL